MYPTKKLSEIAKTTSGGTPLRDKKEFWGGTIPWLKSGELGDNLNIEVAEEFITEEGYNNSSAKLFKKGTLLIAMYGATAGKLGILGFDATTNQAVCSIQNIHNLFIEKYIYFFLLSIREKIIRDSFGGAQPNISKSYLDNLEIPFPLLSTQSHIVARLDSAFANIDEQISLLRANIADVENMKKSALVETFDKNNYELLKISDIAEIINGGTPDTTIPDYWNGEIFWITPKDMGQLEHIYVSETSRKITREGVNNSSAKILPVNSVVLSSRAPIGHLAINTVPMCTNQGCKGLVPLDELNHIYLYYFLLHSRDLLNSLGSGTTFKELSSTKLKEVEIPLPPLPRQHEIVAHLDRVFAETTLLRGECEAQIRDLETLKQSLLEEAFAGRLVTDGDI